MATVPEIEDAIRNAYAAGDIEAVRKLGAARSQLLSNQQPGAPSDFDQRMAQVKQLQAAGKPIPSQLATPDVMNQLTQENAQRDLTNPDAYDYGPEAQKRNAQTAVDIEKGVPEGVKRLWGGLKQTWGGLQDDWNTFVKGVPSRQEQAVRAPDGQLLARLHDRLPDSKELKTIADEVMRRQVAEGEAEQQGATRGGFNAAARTTELGTLALAPEALPGKATTMTGAMLRNSATGALSSGLEFDANPGHNTLVGASFPPLLGIPVSVAPAVKNFVGRALTRAIESGKTAARFENFAKVMPKTAETVTLAQLTGVPELRTLERAAYDLKMTNHFADQTDKFVAETVDALKSPIKPGQDFADDFAVAQARAMKSLKDFKQAASDNYSAGIKDALRIASEGGGGNALRVDGFKNTMNDVFDEVRGLRDRDTARVFNENFMKTKEGMFKQKDTMTVRELADTLVDLNAKIKSKDPLVRKMAGRMRAALESDMGKLEENSSFWADDAAKTILETRKEYARAQKLIGGLADSASYKLLGVKNPEQFDPETVLDNLQKMTNNQRSSIRDFLNENSPELLTTLKNAVVHDAAEKAGTIRAASDSQQDLDKLMEGMFDADKGSRMRTSGLWSPEELKNIEGIKDGLRVVQNHRPSVGGAGTPVKPEDVAINLVARHSAFMARQITRILMSAKASQFFTDPNVYNRLRNMSRSTTASPVNMMARAGLLQYLQDEYPDDSQQ